VNPQEEQGLELAKEGVKDLLAPVTDILRDLLGPASKEIGLGLGDSFRVWRLRRTVRLLEDVKQIASKAGLHLRPVAPATLFPLLEAASLEDNEDLHQRWVALLTNTATNPDDILPCFPDILRQLTPMEAQFLDRVYDELTRHAENRRLGNSSNPAFYGEAGKGQISGELIKSVPPIMIENMERLKLVTRVNVPLNFDRLTNTFPAANHLYISELGRAFVRACRPSPGVRQRRKHG
jgi:hypothetical protein